MSNSFFNPIKFFISAIIFIILFISIFFIPFFQDTSLSYLSNEILSVDISSSGYAWPSPRIYYY